MNHDPTEHETPPGFWGSRYAIGLLIIGAVAGYFLFGDAYKNYASRTPRFFPRLSQGSSVG